MKYKICRRCETPTSLTDFGKYRYQWGVGPSVWCKTCVRQVKREKTSKNQKDKENRRRRRVQRNIDNEAARKTKRDRGEYTGITALLRGIREELSCVDCGESDPDVLDFDHVRGEKRFNLSAIEARKHTLDEVLEELEKCDMRCSNCHRRRHAKLRREKKVGTPNV